MVELRLDTVKDPSAAAAARSRKTPVIITCRPKSEGGYSPAAKKERRSILAEAFALGAEYVDLEWNGTCADLMERTGGRVILSHHDFSGMPADIGAKAQSMLRAAPRSSSRDHRQPPSRLLSPFARSA